MAARTLREKKQQSRVFFDVIFDVYTHLDNRERAWASDWKRKRRILKKEKHENQSGGETMRNASGQQSENDGQWKIKANMNTGDKILGKNSSIKIMCN